MVLKTKLTQQEAKTPEQLLQAWTNGARSIEADPLPDSEREAKHHENNHSLHEILVERLYSFSMSARSFYNVIEEHYPKLSFDAAQQAVRKTLMKILLSSTEAVEAKRDSEERYRGVLQL